MAYFIKKPLIWFEALSFRALSQNECRSERTAMHSDLFFIT